MNDKKLFSREGNSIFPLASEMGSVESRQAFLEGLLAHKNKMGDMTRQQLKELYPASHSYSKSHGYRSRSLMSAAEAGSSVRKVFSKK